jgi:hypothetical protein
VLIAAALLFAGRAALAEGAASAKAPASKAAAGTAPAAEKKGASAAAMAAIENDRDPKAMEILMRMADYLAKAPSLRVTVLSSYDAIQKDGEVIEFGDRRRVELQRPDRLRIEVERSDGDRAELIFDGKAITVYRPADNLYAVVEKPGTVDAVMAYVVKDLQIPVPLARMFTTTFPQQMETLVKSIAYVETNRLFDVPTDHLAVRGDEVDFQIWIAQGDAPLPRRVIITYKNAPGEPQFRALLNDWSLAPVDAARFTFAVPAGAEKVPFIVRESSRRPAAEQKGGAK